MRLGIRAFVLIGSIGVLSTGLLGVVGAPPASAGDAPPAGTDTDPAQRFTELDKQIGVHLADKDADALKQDIGEALKEAKAATDPALKAKFGGLIGRILDRTHDDPTQKAAIVAIGETENPALFKHLRRWLAQPNTKVEPPMMTDAITAAGKIQSNDAVMPLLTIVEKSKVFSLATAAMEALANYGTSKRMRVKILTELISTVSKDSPGVGNRWDASMGEAEATARTRTGEESRARWGALSGPLVTCLNRMTGQNCATAEDWFGIYDSWKGRLDQLFRKE